MKNYTKEEIKQLVDTVSAEAEFQSKDKYLKMLEEAVSRGTDVNNQITREIFAMIVAQQSSADVLAKVLAELFAEE